MTSMETFRCEGLRKTFDGSQALADLTLEFPTSGITAIIGPNGAGKTTLLNVLSGFVRPDEGRCFWGRREITKLPPYQIARLGLARTFQDLRLVFQVSVLDNVMMACPNQRGERLLPALLRFGVAKEETNNRALAYSLLRFVRLADKALEPAQHLSYGQQKLLTLACCLATGARFLLLDEPVTGVDPQMISGVLDSLRDLRDAGKSIVLVEHDIAAVRQLADWTVVMDHGAVITQGLPSKVLEEPRIIEAYLR